MRQGLQRVVQADAGQRGLQALVLAADHIAVQQEQGRAVLRDERLEIGPPAHAGSVLAQVGAQRRDVRVAGDDVLGRGSPVQAVAHGIPGLARRDFLDQDFLRA